MGRFGKMAKKCLITQDLIEKVEWCKNAPHSIIKEEKGGDGVMTWDVKESQRREANTFKLSVSFCRRDIFFKKVKKALLTWRATMSYYTAKWTR